MLDYQLINDLKEYNEYRNFCCVNNISYNQNIIFERKLKARYNKVSRIKQHFIYLFHRRKNIYFLTFTFNDKYLKKCDRTRKDLIKKVLKNFDNDSLFILNIDYGKQNERLHFHCIYGTNSDLDLKKYLNTNYPCFSYTESIRQDCNSIKKISKYINKLSNHAVKDSTCNSRIYFNFKGYGTFSKDTPEIRILYYLDKDCVGLT